MMDANALPEGADYVKLPESYVIFITETDVLGMGQPLYVIECVIRGGGGRFDDGTHIIYVNVNGGYDYAAWAADARFSVCAV